MIIVRLQRLTFSVMDLSCVLNHVLQNKPPVIVSYALV